MGSHHYMHGIIAGQRVGGLLSKHSHGHSSVHPFNGPDIELVIHGSRTLQRQRSHSVSSTTSFEAPKPHSKGHGGRGATQSMFLPLRPQQTVDPAWVARYSQMSNDDLQTAGSQDMLLPGHHQPGSVLRPSALQTGGSGSPLLPMRAVTQPESVLREAYFADDDAVAAAAAAELVGTNRKPQHR